MEGMGRMGRKEWGAWSGGWLKRCDEYGGGESTLLGHVCLSKESVWLGASCDVFRVVSEK